MKPTYFDLTVSDIDAARRLFERVLQWRFERFPMAYEYYRIQRVPLKKQELTAVSAL